MRLPFNPRSHIFKTAFAIAGLIFLDGFGLIFGLIGGALIDQLTSGLRQKNLLKRFLRAPEDVSGAAEQQSLTAAAGASVVWFLCRKEPARIEFAQAALPLFFPEAPRYCAESLTEHPDIDYQATAGFFGQTANTKQKENLSAMITRCGLEASAIKAIIDDEETARILLSAGFRSLRGKNETAESVNSDELDYQILGLHPGATPEEIKKQYYQLAAQFHPDAGAELSPEQQQMTEDAFKRIHTAYERLK